MKQLKITVVLSLLIASIGYSSVHAMRACFARCCKVSKCCKKKTVQDLASSHDVVGLTSFVHNNNHNLMTVNGENGWTVLHWAVSMESDTLVELIVNQAKEKGILDVLLKVRDNKDRTALTLAENLAKGQDKKQTPDTGGRRASLERVSHTDLRRARVFIKILALLETNQDIERGA